MKICIQLRYAIKLAEIVKICIQLGYAVKLTFNFLVSLFKNITTLVGYLNKLLNLSLQKNKSDPILIQG